MLLLLSQNAIVLPVLKWGEIKTVTWFLLTLKSIMIITEKSKPLHCCGHLTTLAEITQCLLWNFPCLWGESLGKGRMVAGFQCTACLGNAAQPGRWCLPNLQSWGGAELLVWSVLGTLNPDCFCLGLQGSALPGLFWSDKKSELIFWKSFSREKLYPTKCWQLSTLTFFGIQGETCLGASRAKLMREF